MSPSPDTVKAFKGVWAELKISDLKGRRRNEVCRDVDYNQSIALRLRNKAFHLSMLSEARNGKSRV
jgi:hypothetical protein